MVVEEDGDRGEEGGVEGRELLLEGGGGGKEEEEEKGASSWGEGGRVNSPSSNSSSSTTRWLGRVSGRANVQVVVTVVVGSGWCCSPWAQSTGGGDDDDGEDGWTWYSVNRINKTNRWLCYLPKPPTLGDTMATVHVSSVLTVDVPRFKTQINYHSSLHVFCHYY